MLRAVTFLSPGVPLELFELVVQHLARELGREVRLESEIRHSGPMAGDDDPFADGRADLGFLCSPSYLYLSSLRRPSVELVPAGFAFGDPRNAGRPVYFSEVIVRRSDPAAALVDLRGRVWGFNDRCSLSGYFSVLQQVDSPRQNGTFFSRMLCTGSHRDSIESVLDGRIDGAAIDSNALRSLYRERPELCRELRVVESLGPFPIQPIVLRAGDRRLRDRIAAALLGLADDRDLRSALAACGLERCVPVDEGLYDCERRALVELGVLPMPAPRS